MSSDTPASTDSWIDALRGVADSLLGAAREKVDRFAHDVEEEKLRLIRLLVGIAVATFSAMMAVAFLSLTIVAVSGERARPYVLGGLTLVYASIAAVIFLRVRRRLHEPPQFASALRGFFLWGPAALQLLRPHKRDH